MMKDADVIVVGAGLTGLRAALELSKAGLSVLVVEQADGVGGRMRTTPHDGFLLDHGFQVILNGYPELRSVSGFSALPVGAFDSGARVRVNGGFVDFYDPRRHPSKLASAITSPLYSWADLLRLFRYASLFPNRHPSPSGETAMSSLRSFGFTERFVSRFLTPFLSGVLLDPSLSLDSAAARFYMRVFSDSSAVLPQQGIQSLPHLLAQQLGVSHILLRSPVERVGGQEVVLASGETLLCQAVVVCVDSHAAAALGGPEQTMPLSASRTAYFAAPVAPYEERLVALNGTGQGVICNVSVPSNVQPSYAPKGQSLVAVTSVGDAATSAEAQHRSSVLGELREWFGPAASEWRHLRTFTIRASVPARPRMEAGAIKHGEVFFAGDYLSYGSQNGALRAGREAARLVLESLGR